MWLNLDLDSGITLKIQIRQYGLNKCKNANHDAFDDWLPVNVTVQFCENTIYTINNESILLAFEVEHLRNTLKNLLENNINDSMKTLDFIEPDFEFTLFPQNKDREDMHLDWRIYFLAGCYSNNHLSFSLYKQEIEYLYAYLMLITKQIKKDEPIIQKMSQNGILLTYYD